MNHGETFLWYDLETFGLNPRYDRIAQFACVRTDANLKVIEEPVVLYCKLSDDYLPDPLSCLVTHITPQEVNEKGLSESEFIGKINEIFSQSRTCVVGYNSLRFDDEFIRYTLFRNFLDPYKREYAKGNSRWDILDLVRAAHDLRPEGINWPIKADSKRPSFKLSDLADANGIENEHAHDALNDVWATLELARLIKKKQPKLFSYYLSLRDKQFAKQLLKVPMGDPLLLTAAQFTSEAGASSIVMPLTSSAKNNNTVIVFDLMQDPTPLINASNTVDQLNHTKNREKELNELTTKIENSLESKENYEETLKESVGIIDKTAKLLKELPSLISAHDQLMSIKGVYQVAINRAPFLSPMSVVTEEVANRLNLDLKRCEANHQRLLEKKMLSINIRRAFDDIEYLDVDDVDQSLYSGDFFSDGDHKLFTKIRETDSKDLYNLSFDFDDKRAHEMLWRYLRRNWPSDMDKEQSKRWYSYCAERIIDPPGKNLITLNFYARKIREKIKSKDIDPSDKEILLELENYGKELCERVGLTYP